MIIARNSLRSNVAIVELNGDDRRLQELRSLTPTAIRAGLELPRTTKILHFEPWFGCSEWNWDNPKNEDDKAAD